MKLSSFFLPFVGISPMLVLGREDEYLRRALQGDSGSDDAVVAPPAGDSGTCFSALSTVEVWDKGATAMEDLQVGDKVLTKSGKYLPVYAFAHRQLDVKAIFHQIFTSSGSPLEVTGEHLVYLDNKAHPVRADSVRVGDHLLLSSGDAGEVVKVQEVEREGLYAPVTKEGNIVVDGVVASNYIALQNNPEWSSGVGFSHHDSAHLLLSPFRVMCHGVSSKLCQWNDEKVGMPYYVSYGIQFIRWADEQNMFVHAIAMVVALALAGFVWMFEMVFGPAMAPLVLAVLGGMIYGIRNNRLQLSFGNVKTV